MLAPVIAVRHGTVVLPADFDAVAVTSRNAIPALPAGCRAAPLLAVGRATAERAAAAGFGTVLDADGDAADLAALARRALPPGARVLVAHARGQGGELMRDLREAGFRVHGRRAYEVTPVKMLPAPAVSAVEGGGLLAAMFLSAATARAFVRLLPDVLRAHLADVDAVAIGEPTAQALAPLPWRRVRVSLRPTLDDVLALL